MGPERLLTYTHNIFWWSLYIVGAVGFCIEVYAGVVCTPYVMMLESMWGIVSVADRGAVVVGTPVGFMWGTVVGCIV